MELNCISLINNLNKAARQYNLSPLAQLVFLRVWERHNLNRWKDEWVYYPDAALMQDVQEKSRQRLYRAKLELERVHILIHKVGINRTSMYTLVALEPQWIEGDERTQSVHNSDTTRTQNDTLIKDYRLKIKDNIKKEIYKEKSQPKKKTYGEYKKVLLSDEEMEKLKAEYPDNWQAWIDKVDLYCAMNGKRYTNYLATIRSWARRDKERGSDWNTKSQFSNRAESSRNARGTETEEQRAARDEFVADWMRDIERKYDHGVSECG